MKDNSLSKIFAVHANAKSPTHCVPFVAAGRWQNKRSLEHS